MAGKIYAGTYTNTILLTNSVQQNPVTLTGSILVNGTNASSDSGFYSSTSFLWSITNLGQITAHGATSYGIALRYGGIIQNGVIGNTLASIVSDETGILLTGAVSSVINDASIVGTFGRGVFLQDGGTLTNAAHALIQGGFEGVAIYNVNGLLTNAGSIIDTGVAGLGVQLYAGVVNNQAGGVISGVYGVGFTAKYSGGTLTNAGTIIGNARDGVELSGGGSVTNSGSISGAIAGVLALYGRTSVSNTATIGGVYAGIDLLTGGSVTNATGAHISGGFGVSFGNGNSAAATGTLVNAGIISGSTYQGVSLNAGGTATNSGSIYGRSAGVAAFYGAAVVSNTGSIGSGFIGVDLAAGGSLTNAAGATISGSYGILLANGPGVGSTGLSNAGLISGSGKAGADLLTGGVFTNLAGGAISGMRYGAYIASVTGTIANYGVITGQIGVYSRRVVQHGTAYPAQVTIINAGTITGTGGVAVSMFASNDLLIDRPGAVFNGGVNSGGGRLELSAGGVGTIGPLGADIVGFSTVTVDPGASWVMGGMVAAGSTLFDQGTLLLRSGGTLVNKGVIEGLNGVNGTLAISTNGGLSSTGTLASSVTVAFSDSFGHLVLTNPLTDFAPTLGFSAGDTIYLPNTPPAGLSETFAPGVGGGTLTLKEGGSIVGAVTLEGSYTTASFSLKSDPNGGADVVIPCFLSGTRIAVADGERRVERLRAGDLVLTHGGALRPIVWVGHRAVLVAGHADPDSVQPVRICADAFGPGRPRRDLLLSPDHAVFHQGALIPVHLLVNGHGVQWAEVAFARYYHLELESHDVLLAEGLAVESYRHTGMGGLLGLAVEGRRATALCAPLALSGPMVARARRHLVVREGIGRPGALPPLFKRGTPLVAAPPAGSRA